MSRVLVADDDSDIRELVRFKLEQAGHEVVTTADGDAALAAIRDQPPDLALLDIMMPRRNGIELVQEIRKNDDLTGLAVVLLTARAREQDVQHGFEVGADDYIVKPFSPRELLSRVTAVLSRAGRS